ncbi:MAG: HAD hydrolase family protein [Advenella sp.]
MKPTLSIPHPAESLVLSKVPAHIREIAATIKLVAFDVDGVLTDGSLWYGENGEQLKRFHSLDGHGLKMLQQSGIMVALVTGREGPVVPRRAAELGIGELYQNVRDKSQLIEELASRHGIGLEQIAFMGDDIIDLPAMHKSGLSISVPNAPSYIIQAAQWVTSLPGGSGAARECCDMILASQGALSQYLHSTRLTGPVIQ